MEINKKIDLNKIIIDNEKVVFGKKVLFVKYAGNSEKLLIVMSTHNQGENYLGLRNFLENQFCDLLFVCDPINSWYLDDDYGEGFHKVFEKICLNYNPAHVFFFGSSMSGYGAILHGLKLNANIIANNPQINLDVTARYSWPELNKNISNLNGKHINLDENISHLWQDSVVFITHGHDQMDLINANLLIMSDAPKKNLIIKTIDEDSHAYPFLSAFEHAKFASNIIELMRNSQGLNLGVGAGRSSFESIKKHRYSIQRTNKKFPLNKMALDASQLWQMRYLHENIGNKVFFENIGIFRDGNVLGGLCVFDGSSWRYICPQPIDSDFLLSSDDLCAVSEKYIDVKNNKLIGGEWLVRSQEDSYICISQEQGEIDVNFESGSATLGFLHRSIKISDAQKSLLDGLCISFIADVYCSNGTVVLAAGCHSENGYHHSNSMPSKQGEWSSLRAIEMLPKLSIKHHDAIFVRINFGGDKKSKNVKIRNMKVMLGYFPENLIV